MPVRRSAQVIQTEPYLMAGPQWARHMLDQDRKQVLTDYLGVKEGQGPLVGGWAEQGSQEAGWLLHLLGIGRRG